MSRRELGPLDCKIYVGGLPETASRSELEAIFGRYGRLRNVWVARRPPGFAFIEFEDNRDAEDAARALDGTRMCGNRVRVELSHGRPRARGPPMGSRYSTSWEERHGGEGGEREGGGRGGGGRDGGGRGGEGGRGGGGGGFRDGGGYQDSSLHGIEECFLLRHQPAPVPLMVS